MDNFGFSLLSIARFKLTSADGGVVRIWRLNNLYAGDVPFCDGVLFRARRAKCTSSFAIWAFFIVFFIVSIFCKHFKLFGYKLSEQS